MEKGTTLVVFHRCGGNSLGYPPNTLLTAEWAVVHGAKAIEYDVLPCEYGNEVQVVVIEPKLIKQANLDIDRLNWEEVKKIDAGNKKFGRLKVSLLEEFLEKIDSSKTAHQVHIKSNRKDAAEVVLSKLKGYQNFILTTFDISVVRQIKKIDSSVRVGWLVKPGQEKGGEGLEDLTAAVAGESKDQPAYSDVFELPPYSEAALDEIIKEAENNRVDAVILCGPRIRNRYMIMKVREAGFEVGAWAVGSNLGLARRLIEYKIDRFTIDNPEQLQS